MPLKRISYGGREGRLKIKIEDANGANEGSWTIMMSDLWMWADMISRKYGIDRKPKSEKKDKDLDWTK